MVWNFKDFEVEISIDFKPLGKLIFIEAWKNLYRAPISINGNQAVKEKEAVINTFETLKAYILETYLGNGTNNMYGSFQIGDLAEYRDYDINS